VSYRLLSVVLPVHNQADHLAQVVFAYLSAVEAVTAAHEVLLVPNGCLDGSRDVCAALADAWPAVRVVPSDRAGWGLAVRLGLAAARGDLLCFANSARTSPGELGLLIRTAWTTPDVVIEARRTIRDRWTRAIGSRLYALECRTLFGMSVADVNGTPKLFPRRFEKLLQLTRDDDLLDAEFNAVVARERYPIIEIPIVSTTRHGGTSTMTYRRAWQLYWGAYQMARAMRRTPS